MNHLIEDEMVELYYGESEGAASSHLQACRKCSARYVELKQNLDAMQPAMTPQRNVDYGEHVWQSLQPKLVPFGNKTKSWTPWMRWRTAAVTVSCGAVLATAFLGGRYWERTTKHTHDDAANPQTARRVVLVVLTDHLDRTERMLVQLQHTDLSDRTENAELQSEARELLASNRLYRTTANHAGDPALANALDRLEGVLAEVANDTNLTAADLKHVRKDMNTDGILFEIRVLLARDPEHESGPKPTQGAFI